MSDSTGRFSNRVSNYIKYRPSYPIELIELFREQMDLSHTSVVGDVGSGTGISTKIFLENGNVVYGIEPNQAMRTAGEQFLSEFINFKSINGTAENTTLPAESLDFVISAQAFHWFDQTKARAEFCRILKPDGYIALIWNERQLAADEFHIEYEKFLIKYADDYTRVRHDNVNESELSKFFENGYTKTTFGNLQEFDFEGLRGRVLSSSYMPTESSPKFSEMDEELNCLFAKFAENGRIKVFYDTNVFYSKV